MTRVTRCPPDHSALFLIFLRAEKDFGDGLAITAALAIYDWLGLRRLP